MLARGKKPENNIQELGATQVCIKHTEGTHLSLIYKLHWLSPYLAARSGLNHGGGGAVVGGWSARWGPFSLDYVSGSSGGLLAEDLFAAAAANPSRDPQQQQQRQ